jgi:hypothetical protein
MRSGYRIFLGLLVIAAAARALTLQWLHPVTWDEIEFFRATRWVAQGLVPFRDFWEHHTPLQWFVFAPVAAFVSDPGVSAIVILRWAQVPLWIAAFAALMLWMRDAGLSLASRLAAVVLAVCSSMFMLAAVEYRIDTVGCALYVIGLRCLQRKRGVLAGVCLCLAAFANIRLGPLIGATSVVYLWTERRRLKPALHLIFGGIATLVICASYFVITNSAAIAFRSVWTDNYIGDKLAQGPQWMFLHRIAVPFGIRPLELSGSLFSPGSIDAATVAIFILGAIGMVQAVRRRDDLTWLAALQIVNILFVAIMKFIHHYHFEIVILLMLPFVALVLETLDRRATVAIVLIASVVNVYASVFRGKEADMAFEDFVMREADRRTPPDVPVFDGVGRALNRRPAHRRWFLPALVPILEKTGRAQPYSAQQLHDDPPAVVISDFRVYSYLRLNRELAREVTRHYMPAYRNLWVPAMSGIGTNEWVAPVSGRFRVFASESLARHPWFREPLEIGTFENNLPPFTGVRPDRVDLVRVTVDGAVVAPIFDVRRKQRVRVEAPSGVGVFILPDEILFRQLPAGVTLDAVNPAITHVPRIR